jgi:hypothetical protein
MNVFAHAEEITNDLAAAVAALETHCAKVFARIAPDSERLQEAIATTWPELIRDAQVGSVSPNIEYIASVYHRLAANAGIEHPGEFTDRTDMPWLEYYKAGCGDERRCEDAWVIAELFWGGYVKFLHLTLGWLLMNAIRIQQHLPAIMPLSDSTAQFTDYLRWSGPDTFDAENLRALFYQYEQQNAG